MIKSGHFWTTYLLSLVNVVCEQPLILIYPFRIYEYTDILCVNESEAQIILGQEDPIETEADIEKAMNLLLLKCPIIVITLGKFFWTKSVNFGIVALHVFQNFFSHWLAHCTVEKSANERRGYQTAAVSKD